MIEGIFSIVAMINISTVVGARYIVTDDGGLDYIRSHSDNNTISKLAVIRPLKMEPRKITSFRSRIRFNVDEDC